MNPERWGRIDQLFHAALERDEASRAGFVEGACAGDAELRREVTDLLAAHGDAGSFLEGGPSVGLQSLQPGQELGSYRILGLIGRGGMGEVYRAHDARLRRDVAIKVLPALSRSDAGTLLQRFESEALLAASVQHPAVVPVYERGQLPDGTPYYAMKLVSGRSLQELVEERHTLGERIALLPEVIAVAEALAHAHGRRIVHRDVKPANVIVGELGETVLIDWGLAKSLASGTEEPQAAGAPAPADRTAAGAVIGTPAYMPPEQARGQAVDERADVFSLGATLHHVLAGHAPYAGDTPAVLRDVEEGRRAPLSAEVPAELTAIVERAMKLDKAERYPSAREMAEELRRFQTGQLVLSYRYSARELIARWARRHRTLLAATAAFAALLAAGAVLSVRRIVAERDRANAEAEASRRVSDFMTTMFKVSDPGEARGNAVTAREILDKASGQIEGGLSRNPRVQSQLMDTMAQVYLGLGLYAKARPLAEKAAELRQQQLGPDHPDTLASLTTLGNVEASQGQFGAARETHQRVLDVRLRTLGAEHPDTLASKDGIAYAEYRLGHYAVTEPLEREVLPARQRLLGPDDPGTLNSINLLGLAIAGGGRNAEAESLFRQAAEGRRRVLGPDHPQTLTSLNNLAIVVQDQGRWSEAQKIFEEELEIQRRVLGPEHFNTLISLSNIAWVNVLQGRYTEAEKIYLPLIETERRVLGPEHFLTVWSTMGLAREYMGQRRFDEAVRLNRDALEVARRVLGPEHPKVLEQMTSLANAQMAVGRNTEAEKLLRETLALDRRIRGPQDPDLMLTLMSLAQAQMLLGRFEEAEGPQLEALEMARRAFGPRGAMVGRNLYALARLSLRRGDRKRALGFLRQAAEAGLSPQPAGFACIQSCNWIALPDDDGLAALRGDPEFEALHSGAGPH